MKNLMFKSFLFACLVLTITAMSCSPTIDLPNDGINVSFKVDFNGEISDDTTIEYHDEEGDLKIIPLEKNWKKSFQVQPGFNFYFHVKGQVKGKLKVSSTVAGTEVDKEESDLNYDEMTAFDILREEVL